MNAWHTDPSVLSYLCNLTPACSGFNSAGKLTTNSTNLIPTQGSSVFVKIGATGGVEPIFFAAADIKKGGTWGGASATVTGEGGGQKQSLPLRPHPRQYKTLAQRVKERGKRR